MSILCGMFGHKVRTGVSHCDKISTPCFDGIGRAFRDIWQICPRCGESHIVAKIIDSETSKYVQCLQDISSLSPAVLFFKERINQLPLQDMSRDNYIKIVEGMIGIVRKHQDEYRKLFPYEELH